MNALLIAGMIGLGLWWQHHRQQIARRNYRPSDDAFSHALRSSDAWA